VPQAGVNLLAQPPAQAPAQAPATRGAPAVAAQDAPSFSATVSSVKTAATGVIHQAQEGVRAATSVAHHAQGGVQALHAAVHGETIHDWSARIHAKKYELGDGYIVLIFLGQVPDDPSHWRTCPSFVGAHVAFVNTEAEQCDNCRDQAELVVEGFVHLNAAIAKQSGLSSFDPSVITPYLRDNLHWRVQAVRSLQSSLGVSKISDTFYFNPGGSRCGRARATRIPGGHCGVEHVDSRTRCSLPDCWTCRAPPPHHSWTLGRCSSFACLKCLFGNQWKGKERKGKKRFSKSVLEIFVGCRLVEKLGGQVVLLVAILPLSQSEIKPIEIVSR